MSEKTFPVPLHSTVEGMQWLYNTATDNFIRELRDANAELDALRAEVERLRDLHWREVESLRERLDKEEEERGRQYGMRVQAETEVERLMSLVQAWYEGRARIGAHMTFVDQRFYDGVRCQRTGWPGDDASGDGGPTEES